jgi:hypothetical protein
MAGLAFFHLHNWVQKQTGRVSGTQYILAASGIERAMVVGIKIHQGGTM